MSAQPEPQSKPIGPGTVLASKWSRYDKHHCSKCRDLTAKMDEWGVEGCYEHLKEIVDDIYPRARWLVHQMMPKRAKALEVIRMDEAAIKLAIARDVKAAIKEAERGAPKQNYQPKNK